MGEGNDEFLWIIENSAGRGLEVRRLRLDRFFCDGGVGAGGDEDGIDEGGGERGRRS